MESNQIQIKVEATEADNDEDDHQQAPSQVAKARSRSSRLKGTDPDKKPLLCSHCPRTFKHKSKLNEHLKSLTKPCGICGKTFGSSGDYKNHRRVHTGERPYACNLCDKRFKEKSALRVHTKVHTGEKPYTCEVCNKCSSTNGHLQSHMLLHNGEVNDAIPQYACSFCEKRFYNKTECTRHIGVHTGVKPYSCNQCNKGFLHRYHLTRHGQRHRPCVKKPNKIKVEYDEEEDESVTIKYEHVM